MKKRFEGVIHSKIPDGININEWLDSDILRVLERSSDTHFSVVSHPNYTCTEYKTKLNLFAFSRFRLYIPITIIGPPVSVDSVGYNGDLNKLVADYKRRRGLYLVLNLPEYPDIAEKAAIGETLSSCYFYNHFHSFEDYFTALRGSYRRRLKKALKKGDSLRVEKINNSEYSEELHKLYKQVRQNSKYPLETLSYEFFKCFENDIFVFFDNTEPIAFVSTKQFEKEMSFVFGGMDYSKRDKFDLHYNMLLFVLRLAIQQRVECVNFGQTAEHSKQRIGCTLSKRYMVAFSGNLIINQIIRFFGDFLEYRTPKEIYRCFSQS